jgi:hypothetical protein
LAEASEGYGDRRESVRKYTRAEIQKQVSWRKEGEIYLERHTHVVMRPPRCKVSPIMQLDKKIRGEPER